MSETLILCIGFGITFLALLVILCYTPDDGYEITESDLQDILSDEQNYT